MEPFLVANAPAIQRLHLATEIRVDPQPRVLLTPAEKIGALPLLDPSTRRVAAGVLIEPRFRWASLGRVFSRIGFSVAPVLGRAALVPGSAREVPVWLLAGPVIERIAGMLKHRRRGFTTVHAYRQSPRGTIDWGGWARHQVPRGDWTQLPCTYSEPADDPQMMAAVRWTLHRLVDDLSLVTVAEPGRMLLSRSEELLSMVGPGPSSRPSEVFATSSDSEWVRNAFEAMGWVAEERGLGGARSLNGLPWDLAIDQVWEAWISSIAQELGRRLGMTSSPYGGRRHVLQWQGPIRSMTSLLPDAELRGHDRVVWIDAKYKAHLLHLAQRGWDGVTEKMRHEHRADLHQALAYAALANVSEVVTILAYPSINIDDRTMDTVATVTAGQRSVRLVLLAVPFGFRTREEFEAHMDRLRKLIGSPL
jgi:hypothetical protein